MPVLAQIVDGVVTQRFQLDRAEVRIGRSAENEIQIDDLAVSGAHAVIESQTNRYLEGKRDYFIRDLGSTNGTYVNGKPVERRMLRHDDEVRIGWNAFKFMDEDEAGFERTAYILPQD